MIEKLLEQYLTMLEGVGLSNQMAMIIENATVLVLIILLAFLADRITKRVLIGVIRQVVKRTKTTFDDILLQRKVFNRLAHIAPAVVINATVVFLFDAPDLVAVIKKLTGVYMILVTALVIDSLISALHDIYNQLPVSRGRNIKGYMQVVKIIIYIFAILLVIDVFSEKSLTGLFTGLGAFAAVIMLVFKDSILGLTASIQLSANDMVKVGDWISMPQFNADGDVIDISLTTVKVRNWDKTIATIPTYALVSDSFNNWRGMQLSGGRRIMRSVNIDMRSIRFMDQEIREQLSSIAILKPYLEEKQKELEAYNKRIGADDANPVNGRRMTNLGTFRKYLELYLRNHPKVNQELTFIIRHLQPTDKGLPIEIYVFSKDQEWEKYEAVQADIFDHVLAVIPYFDLRIFQNPSGEDWRMLAERIH